VDGVFFELARARDFRAVGQEPGWQLEIRQGAEMRFTFDYGKNSAVTPAARVKVDPSTGTRTYHAVVEANDLRVEIVPCRAPTYGRPFAATVTVTLNGQATAVAARNSRRRFGIVRRLRTGRRDFQAHDAHDDRRNELGSRRSP
jgi:hypothetical protein